MAKKECPITREQFNEHAEELTLSINGAVLSTAQPREFASDSLGWNFNFKTSVVIDGMRCPVQVGCNVTLIGSKELEQ